MGGGGVVFRTVGQALRWYVRATAQADGVRSIWPQQGLGPSAPVQAGDQEATRLAIWAIWEALSQLTPNDRALLLAVRAFAQRPEDALPGWRRRSKHAHHTLAWRVDRAEACVARRLNREGLLVVEAT